MSCASDGLGDECGVLGVDVVGVDWKRGVGVVGEVSACVVAFREAVRLG